MDYLFVSELSGCCAAGGGTGQLNYEFMRAEAMASTGQLGNMLEESQLGLAAGAQDRSQHCALLTALRS